MSLRGWVNSFFAVFVAVCAVFLQFRGLFTQFYPPSEHVLKVTQANMCQDTINYKWFGVLVTNSFNLKVTQTNNGKSDSVWVNKHK